MDVVVPGLFEFFQNARCGSIPGFHINLHLGDLLVFPPDGASKTSGL